MQSAEQIAAVGPGPEGERAGAHRQNQAALTTSGTPTVYSNRGDNHAQT